MQIQSYVKLLVTSVVIDAKKLFGSNWRKKLTRWGIQKEHDIRGGVEHRLPQDFEDDEDGQQILRQFRQNGFYVKVVGVEDGYAGDYGRSGTITHAN